MERLEERLRENSSNSSRPRSSDPPGARPSRERGGERGPGGQPGDRGTARELVADVDEVVDHWPAAWSGCGAGCTSDNRNHHIHVGGMMSDPATLERSRRASSSTGDAEARPQMDQLLLHGISPEYDQLDELVEASRETPLRDRFRSFRWSGSGSLHAAPEGGRWAPAVKAHVAFAGDPHGHARFMVFLGKVLGRGPIWPMLRTDRLMRQ